MLLVDHDQDSREILGVALEGRGAAVRLVGIGRRRLGAAGNLASGRPVSDSAFPDRDAYALVAKVHGLESDRGGRIPALALTSSGSGDERMRRMLSEVQRSLPKPVEPAILTAEIARLTGRERRRAHR